MFEPNSSRVNTASDGFKNVVKELNAFNADKIVIVGHTDNRGADAYNLQLSIERGENMRKALLSSLRKVPQFSVTGMGESQPITTNETAEGRQKNRRVEIEVFRYD